MKHIDTAELTVYVRAYVLICAYTPLTATQPILLSLSFTHRYELAPDECSSMRAAEEAGIIQCST